MQNAAQAYSNTAQKTVTPREREASLLIKSASQMQSAIDNWQNGDRETLRHALQYNRKLWTVFVSSISGTENPLPVAIKNNIGSLGVFIFRHTVSVLARPSPEKLDVLIAINRDIAAGLREQA